MASKKDDFKKIVSGKRYDEGTSLSLAMACDLAYQSKKIIESKVKKWGYSQVEFFEVKKGSDIDTQCFIMSDEKNTIVVFRGSDDLSDWFANFQAIRNPGPLSNSKAHGGFQDALYPAVIKITEIIDRFNSGSKKLWITGHSLGGALCSLYAGMLIENGYKVYGIYTFASPRPGDDQFAAELNKYVVGPHYRVVNTGDIVPHIPPEPFFSHAGKRIILKEHKRETTKASWFSQRVSALKEFVKTSSDLLDVAGNHKLSADDESYIPRLLEDFTRTQSS